MGAGHDSRWKTSLSWYENDVANEGQPPEPLFEQMKRHVGFGPDQERAVRELGPPLRPLFPAVIDEFYRRLEGEPSAQKVFEGASTSIASLRGTLLGWLHQLVAGPWDEAYFALRSRIGRRHVEIRLPQHLNITAMSVLREHLVRACHERAPDSATGVRWASALCTLLDLELATMLHTYSEDHDAQLRRHERLATFGQLTSSIGHELRNPLGVIESSVYLLRRKLGDDPAALRHADKIHAQVVRSNRIINSMLDIVRERAPSRIRVTPRVLAERAAAQVLADLGIAVELRVEADLPRAFCDPEQLQQVLWNLLLNAVEASGPGGAVCLCVERRGHDVELVVEDDGPGVAPGLRARVFEPLVTSKDGGVGLGLALCRKIMEAHGGRVELRAPVVLSGAAFAVVLEGEPEA